MDKDNITLRHMYIHTVQAYSKNTSQLLTHRLNNSIVKSMYKPLSAILVSSLGYN